jgi:hypothetical protein
LFWNICLKLWSWKLTRRAFWFWMKYLTAACVNFILLAEH